MASAAFDWRRYGAWRARLLEAVRIAWPEAKVYQAGSSEMFGTSDGGLQSEDTSFHPRCLTVWPKFMRIIWPSTTESPMGCLWLRVLFNHESERTGPEFVTRKIAQAVARIHAGTQTHLHPRHQCSSRLGFAGDYTQAMFAMLSRDTPTDFVVATGESWSVEDFASRAFAVAGLDMAAHLRHDPALLRPADIPVLCGDASRARAALGWAPSLTFDQLVERMVTAELRRLRR